MSKVLIAFCFSFFVAVALGQKPLPEVSVTVINCERNKDEIVFSLPLFGTCKESSTVKLKPGEKFNCTFIPNEVKPYKIQAYAPTGTLRWLPIMYHGFCIGVAAADYGYQYVPCDDNCLETATNYVNPYEDLKNQ